MLTTSKKYSYKLILLIGTILCTACGLNQSKEDKIKQMNNSKTASEILGNPEYLAISYGGYREISRDAQPTIPQIKNDLKILSALGIRIIRTYNVQFEKAGNVLQAIRELHEEDSSFEMYVMLGIWIDCENAWTDKVPNHDKEDFESNASELERAVALASKYSEIVKILAVGNEAMVKWATSYYVQPSVILKWVNHLQELKQTGKLDKDLWITSSDNFASWGGGDAEYHCEDLENLIKAVDYVSLHTYPMHDTHYHPVFWGTFESELHLNKTKIIERAMTRALLYAKKQYVNSVEYIHSVDSTKEVHIGETGWASVSNGLYGANGSKACDEYKEGVYYKAMREWTNEEGISCFYFQAFNEKWKDAKNPNGSENHFGLFRINGQAKYAIWNKVDEGVFSGLTRNGNSIEKTLDGNLYALLEKVETPPLKQFK